MSFGGPGPSVDDIVAGHRALIQRMHARGLSVYGGTLTPFQGAMYWSETGEGKRQAVNHWIRTSGAYDGVIDFDAAVRDPDNPTRIRSEYDPGDALHFNDTGYRVMGDAVDLALFAPQRLTTELTAQDHAEIRQLYARYNQGTDLRDAAMWLSTFAADAVFRFGGQEYVGQDALAEYRRTSFAGSAGGPKRRHWNSSLVLTPTSDGVEGRAYFQLMDASETPPSAIVSGYYDDVFTRTADGWRIKSRTVIMDAAR